MSKATISHQQGEYVVDAPDGYRFADLECHQLVVDYSYDGLSRKEGRRGAEEERRTSTLELCPADCHCKE